MERYLLIYTKKEYLIAYVAASVDAGVTTEVLYNEEDVYIWKGK